MSMTASTPLEDAEFRAAELHQHDSYGSDSYLVGHLRKVHEHVLARGGNETAQIAAWLHDAIEDHGDQFTLQDAHDFGYEVAGVLDLLTHDRRDSYATYLDRIVASGNRDALLVKLADASVNLARSLDDLHRIGVQKQAGWSVDEARTRKVEGWVSKYAAVVARLSVALQLGEVD
jgi:(p)ppGpp synthase/HD superfamily hydrolase